MPMALNNPELCFACINLFVQPDMPVAEAIRAPYRGELIEKSATEGCRICILMWDNLTNTHEAQCEHSLYHLQIPLEGCLLFHSSIPYEFSLQATGCCGRPIVTLDLKRCADIDEQSRVMVFRDPLQRSSIPVATELLSRDTKDESRLRTAKTWIRQCLQDHASCNRTEREQGGALPARLINVGSPHHEPYLELKAAFAHESKVQYATLSHRWGYDAMPTLRQSNIQQLQQRIDPQSLSPGFRDTIWLSRHLGIPYLWIDALCIIQDDPDDCEQEISIMGSIYSKALCNFGAVAAAEKPVGLFVESDPRLISPFRLVVERKDLHFACYAFQPDRFRNLEYKALIRRGWVLQERLLSQRTIFFDEQLIWECSELLACEAFPEGLPFVLEDRWGKSVPFKMASLLESDLFSTSESRQEQLYRKWKFIAHTFTNCNLTYQTDLFPAISGLAKCFQQELGDEYLAGLWKGNLITSLLWFRTTPPRKEGRRADLYLAPSWSWAALATPIRFVGMDDLHWVDPQDKGEVHIAKLLHASVKVEGSDPMGKISGGHIRLSSHMRPGRSRASIWDSECACGLFEWFDYGYDEHNVRSMAGTFLLALSWRSNTSYGEFIKANGELSKKHHPARVRGLILEPVHGALDTYRRVGMFNHFWGALASPEHRMKGPEFSDFDPEDMGQFVEVTIV